MTAAAQDPRGSRDSLLAVSGLAVRFGALRALDGVDLTVARGELVALAGENGAGKTTLVRCIAGDIPATSGRIVIGGRTAGSGPTDAARAGVAMVWQDLALCDNLDIAANLLLGRERRRHLLFDTRFHATAAGVASSWSIRAGVSLNRIRTLCFTPCGLTAGLAGIMLASQLNSIAPTSTAASTCCSPWPRRSSAAPRCSAAGAR